MTPDRVELMAEIVRLSYEVKLLATPLDDAAFNLQPDGGSAWSVGQCIDHLVRANRIYVDALEEAAWAAHADGKSSFPPPYRPGRLGSWFLANLEPPVGRRTVAPKKIQPASRCSKEATLIAFAGEQQRWIELVRATAPLDCNCIHFKNPLAYGLRVFNLSTGLLVLAAHERRHLLQARNVVAKLGLPRHELSGN